MWIDLHCHILPGVDDGSRSIEESLEMANIAASFGTDTIVCTNHANIPRQYENYESGYLRKSFERLCKEVESKRIPIKLIRGNEIFVTDDIRRVLTEKKVIPIGSSKYYLCEFSFDANPDYISEMLYGMLSDGYHPVLAHPERYFCVQEYPEFVFKWVRAGILIQVNKGSLLGKFSKHVEKAAWTLFDHGLITCIASDAHSSEYRTPSMREIAGLFRDSDLEDAMHILMHHNPKRILEGKKIDNSNIIPFEKKGWY